MKFGGKTKRNILGIGTEMLIDYSAQKMTKISAQDYYEYGYKRHWQKLTYQK